MSLEGLFEKLSRIPTGKKILYLVLSLGVLVGGFYMFFYSDSTKKISKLTNKYNVLQSELQIYEDLSGHRAELESKKKIVDNRMAKVESQLPQYAEIYSILGEIHDYGELSGMQITQFQREGAEVMPLYTRIPMDIAAEGTFPQLLDFLDNIRGKGDRRVVHIEDLVIEAPKEDGAITRIKSKFRAVAFQTGKVAKTGQLPMQGKH
jgi:Tfp pilus assembly protein PilO